MEVVSGDNWSCKSCRAPVKSSPPTNQHPTNVPGRYLNARKEAFVTSGAGGGVRAGAAAHRSDGKQVGGVYGGRAAGGPGAAARGRHGRRLQPGGRRRQRQQGRNVLLPLHAQAQRQAHRPHLVRRRQRPQQSLPRKYTVSRGENAPALVKAVVSTGGD